MRDLSRHNAHNRCSFAPIRLPCFSSESRHVPAYPKRPSHLGCPGPRWSVRLVECRRAGSSHRRHGQPVDPLPATGRLGVLRPRHSSRTAGRGPRPRSPGDDRHLGVADGRPPSAGARRARRTAPLAPRDRPGSPDGGRFERGTAGHRVHHPAGRRDAGRRDATQEARPAGSFRPRPGVRPRPARILDRAGRVDCVCGRRDEHRGAAADRRDATPGRPSA